MGTQEQPWCHSRKHSQLRGSLDPHFPRALLLTSLHLVSPCCTAPPLRRHILSQSTQFNTKAQKRKDGVSCRAPQTETQHSLLLPLMGKPGQRSAPCAACYSVLLLIPDFTLLFSSWISWKYIFFLTDLSRLQLHFFLQKNREAVLDSFWDSVWGIQRESQSILKRIIHVLIPPPQGRQQKLLPSGCLHCSVKSNRQVPCWHNSIKTKGLSSLEITALKLFARISPKKEHGLTLKRN